MNHDPADPPRTRPGPHPGRARHRPPAPQGTSPPGPRGAEPRNAHQEHQEHRPDNNPPLLLNRTRLTDHEKSHPTASISTRDYPDDPRHGTSGTISPARHTSPAGRSAPGRYTSDVRRPAGLG